MAITTVLPLRNTRSLRFETTENLKTFYIFFVHLPSLISTVGIHDLFSKTKITGVIFRDHVRGRRTGTRAEFAGPKERTTVGNAMFDQYTQSK